MEATSICNYGGCKFHITRLLDYVKDKEFSTESKSITEVFDKCAGVLPWWLAHCTDVRLLMYHMSRILDVNCTQPIIVLDEPFQIIDGWHRLMKLGLDYKEEVKIITLTQDDMLDFLRSQTDAEN